MYGINEQFVVIRVITPAYFVFKFRICSTCKFKEWS